MASIVSAPPPPGQYMIESCSRTRWADARMQDLQALRAFTSQCRRHWSFQLRKHSCRALLQSCTIPAHIYSQQAPHKDFGALQMRISTLRRGSLTKQPTHELCFMEQNVKVLVDELLFGWVCPKPTAESTGHKPTPKCLESAVPTAGPNLMMFHLLLRP